MAKQITPKAVESIFDEWNNERDQMFAVCSAIEQLLRPKAEADSPEFNAWKLAEIAVDRLGSISEFTACKKNYGGIEP